MFYVLFKILFWPFWLPIAVIRWLFEFMFMPPGHRRNRVDMYHHFRRW